MTAVFLNRIPHGRQTPTLKQQIRLWIMLIIVLLGFSMALSFYFIEKTNTEKKVHEQLQQIVSLQGEYIDAWMRERVSDIHLLASLNAFKTLDKPAMTVSMTAIMKNTEDYSSLYFVNKDGIIELGVNMQLQGSVDVSDRDYFKAGRAGKDYVSEVIYSKISGKPVISISSPLRGDKGEFIGVLAGTIQLNTFHQAAQNLKFGKTGEMYIIDSNDDIVSKANQGAGELSHKSIASDIVRRAKAGIISSSAYDNYDGERVYGAYRWTNDRRWLVICEVRSSEVLQNVYEVLGTLTGITILFLLLCLGNVLMLSAKHLERPLRYLLRGTEIIQEGQYGYQIDYAPFSKAPAELQRLCAAYNEMSRKLKATVQLLEHTSVIDQLTETYNRRYMMEEGSRLLMAELAAGKPVSVIMTDIDRFKTINDTYGHVAGDRVIRYFSDRLTRYATDRVIVSRYGGEEFVMLLVGMDIGYSAQLAEKIREELAASPYREDDMAIAITASFGVAGYEGTAERGTNVLEDLVSRADQALYDAKRQGRNRTVVFEAG